MMADDLIERLTGTLGRVTAIDRLRLYAHAPETFEFDVDTAEDVVIAIDLAAEALASKDAALSEMRRAIVGGEPDPTLSHGQFLEMIRLAEDARLGAIARATAAESQLEMARKALERAAIIIKEDRNTTFHCGTVRGDPATMDAPTREAIADYDAVLAEIARALADGETK